MKRFFFGGIAITLMALCSGCSLFDWMTGKGEPAPQAAQETSSDGQQIARPPSNEVQVKTPPAPRRLLAFDFGTSVAWEGFMTVPGAKSVSISSGARFGSDETRESDFPDPLIADYVAADDMTVTISGLQKGQYRAAAIAQNVGLGMVPAKPFQISANGKTVIDVDVTPEWYFSEKGFFYGVQFDDLPQSPYWDRYIEPVAPWRTFGFDSKGELVLKLADCRLYALVIAPENDVTEKEFGSFIEATQAARKAYFLFNKFHFTAEQPKGKVSGGKKYLERGYVVFKRDWGEDCTYSTLPKPAEMVSTLEAAGTPGERVPVSFAVRTVKPLSNISVSVTDLSAPGGKIIPSEQVLVQSVRYMMRPTVGADDKEKDAYDIFPETIQNQGGVSLPADITKRWWLTVAIPQGAEAGTYSGQIRVTPNDAPGTVVALRVEVYPFTLARPAASIGVWYADPGTAGYVTGMIGGATALKPGEARPSRFSERDRKIEAYRISMLDADLKSLSAHGFNGITVDVPRLVSVAADGKTRLDFVVLDAYPPLLKKYEINTAFPGQTYLLTTARQITRVGLNGTPIPEYSPLHEKAYKDAVAQIRDWWKDAGMTMLAYVVDEPREKDVKAWNRDLRDTLDYLALVRQVGEFPSTVTTMRDEQDGVQYAPILETEDVVQPQPSVNNKKSVDYARRSGKPLRFYNGGWDRYAFGFYVWTQKPEGYWQWHYDNRMFSYNPFWDSDDGYVVFPSPDGPVSTVRYERAAQGIYDYRYALTLAEYVARAKASYNPDAIAAAREGERLLGEIRADAPGWLMDKKGRPLTVPNETLSEWRAEMAGSIVAIQKALQ